MLRAQTTSDMATIEGSVIQMAPSTFSVSPNGVGLGDTKTFLPSQTIGSTVFDRSPGSASSIGPSTFGGSVNILSRNLGATMTPRGTVSAGSFNTKLYDVEFDSGQREPALVAGRQHRHDHADADRP